MKTKLHLSIKGNLSRPKYFTTIDVYSQEDDPDYEALAYAKLKASTFPDIKKDDIKVLAMIVSR